MDREAEARAVKLQKAPSPFKQQIMLIALMLSMMLVGWAEGAIGPLLEPIQEYWHVNDSSLGAMFIAAFLGAVLSGLTNVWVTDLIGFGYAAPLGAFICAIANTIQGLGLSWNFFLVGWVINGFGMGIQDVQANNIASRLPSGSTGLFLVQASFSLGATVAPFISTPFAQRLSDRPYLFFLVVAAVALVTSLMMLAAFGGATEAGMRAANDAAAEASKTGAAGDGRSYGATAASGSREHGEVSALVAGAEDLETALDTQPLLPSSSKETSQSGSLDKLRRIFSSPAVWAIWGWDFFYCGAEVTVSSFLTSFLIRERGGTAAAGYATVGFWAAATVGRAVSAPLSRALGYGTTVYVISLLSIGASIFIALVHNLTANAIAFAFIGLLYGPLYPCALMVVTERLDDDLRGGIIGLMGTFGGAGGAFLPLVAGALSDKYGIATIQGSSIVMILISLVCWMFAPRKTL